MIIPLNIKSENTYYKIFEAVKIAFARLNSNTENTKGRPRKYSDMQIVCCMLYGVKNSIFSLRELEYRIKQDYVFKSIIEIDEVPDYSTFSIRAKKLEKHIYYGIYAMFVELIDPETRLCAIDGTALRSSKYDSEAKSGKGTRLGYFKGYKLHCIATVADGSVQTRWRLSSSQSGRQAPPHIAASTPRRQCCRLPLSPWPGTRRPLRDGSPSWLAKPPRESCRRPACTCPSRRPPRPAPS